MDFIASHPFASFYVPWAAAAAASANAPGTTGGPSLPVAGYDLPVAQLVLAVAGVLMARPISPRREPKLGTGRSILVSAIMILLAVVWVAESRPGPLFTFVVAIGLGFSGYSLIELAGRELESLMKRAFAAIGGVLESLTETGKDK